MSQDSAASSNGDTPRYWLHEILNFTEDTRPLFLNDQETMRIYEIEVNLNKLDETRSKELDLTREKLRALSRQAEAYKQSTQRPQNALTEKQHNIKLLELDTKKFGLAKTVTDLEQAIASAEVGLGRNKETAAAVEKEDPLAGSQERVGDALKLRIYRDMGFIPISENERYSGLLIKSDASQDVHSLPVASGLSNFEYASKAWQLVL